MKFIRKLISAMLLFIMCLNVANAKTDNANNTVKNFENSMISGTKNTLSNTLENMIGANAIANDAQQIQQGDFDSKTYMKNQLTNVKTGIESTFNQAMLDAIEQQAYQTIGGLKKIEISANIFDSANFDNTNPYARMLISFYGNKEGTKMLFFEPGYIYYQGRNTANLGLGWRQLLDDKKIFYGVNTFLDMDIDGRNTRASVGGEFALPYLKFHGNIYQALSDWHDEPGSLSYEEKPANGYDVGLNAYLPFYSAINLGLTISHWKGSVDLFNTDDYEDNPTETKFSIEYHPVQLFGLEYSYHHTNNGTIDNQVRAVLNYNFDEPLVDQLSPTVKNHESTLAQNMLSMVDRQYGIVLQRRLKKLIVQIIDKSLNDIHVITTTDNLILKAKPKNGQGPYQYEWSYNSDNTAVTSNKLEPDEYQFSSATAGDYIVSVLATDVNGAQGRDFYNVTVTLPPYYVSLEQIKSPIPANDTMDNVKATVTGGVGPYTFIWTDVTTGTSEKHSGINSTTDTYKLAKSAPGTYEVKVEVTDSSSPNLTANSSIDLTVDPLQDGHVKCPDAPSGSTFMYDNNQYYVVDDTTIKTNISSQNYVCTTQVTNMTQLFIGRTLATYPGLELWDVSNVTAMNAMFYQASSFYQDISMWDVANVTDYSDFATDSPIDNTDYMPAKFRV